MEELAVTQEEAGQKLLNYLARRLDASAAELHKWIRTGQVRIDGRRSKPFDRVEAGQSVRVPPFASLKTNRANGSGGNIAAGNAGARQSSGSRLVFVYEGEHVAAVDKPAGLATQGGKGGDSVATRLKTVFAGRPFIPAPAHRLDKEVSGVLLIGMSYQGLRFLSDAFKTHSELVAPGANIESFHENGMIRNGVGAVAAGFEGAASSFDAEGKQHVTFPLKEYLALVMGEWKGVRLLDDQLVVEDGRVRVAGCSPRDIRAWSKPGNRPEWERRRYGGEMPAPERGQVLLSGEPPAAKRALLKARCLRYDGKHSLLHVTLYTGRKHQIRVQLAAAGFPIVGDGLHGDGSKETGQSRSPLCLRCVRITMPQTGLCPVRVFEAAHDGEGMDLFRKHALS
ncbi:MAG: RluA family pseudouridine synthase [Mailhella sp.]|nr:RluA family pseudouridine synthase [Mailhella sp.]